MRGMKRRGIGLLLLVVLAGGAGAASSEEAAWESLRAGRGTALLRHALAPGTADPPEFTLGDCATQRNLSEAGRAQARRIGEAFRARGIQRAAVYSSQWCRCLETARALALGPVTELPALNSFFEHWHRREAQTKALQAWFAAPAEASPAPRVLVSHQVNIAACTGVSPRSGEMVVVEPADSGEGLEIIGRVAF